MAVVVDRADDYGYRVDLELSDTASVSATITKADLTLSTPSGNIVKPFDALASKPFNKSQQTLSVANAPGLQLATLATAVVSYVDSAGKAGSFSVTKPVQACWNSFEAHCATANIEAGQTSKCSGGIDWCAPMHLPLAGSEIQWQSQSPAIAAVAKDGTLTGFSNGVTTVVASFGLGTTVSHAFSVCVGPSCKPDSLTISPQTGSLAVGATLLLQAAGHWAGAGEDLTAAAQWRSTNPVVGDFNTVGSPNLFTALARGTTSIEATYAGAVTALTVVVK